MSKSRNTDRKILGVKARRNWGGLNPIQRVVPMKGKDQKFTRKELAQEIESHLYEEVDERKY